jgi:serine/threonine-protein kinase
MAEPRSAAIPAEGDIIAGKYRIERTIGAGGMGVVVAARHLYLNQDVALKFLLPEIAEDPALAARFLREAQAAVAIQSEHVARVLDVGTLESGAPYMVMEYLRGADLHDLVEQSGPLSVEDAVDYILQACEALAEAHKLGLVHRDLKPSNLFLTRRADGSPLIKVLDFGIAKALGSQEHALTSTGASMGSPSYMSPEQVRNSKTVDPRSDIWSIGASLQELLTTAPPFESETLPALCAMIVTDPPVRLRSARPELPETLEAVILRCLEKDPQRRFRNVAALARALLPLAATRSRLSIERILKVLPSMDAADTILASASTGEAAPAGGPSAASTRGEAARIGSREASEISSSRAGQTSASMSSELSPERPRSSSRGKIAGAVGLAAMTIATATALLLWLRSEKTTPVEPLPAAASPALTAPAAPIIQPAQETQRAEVAVPSAVPSVPASASATAPAAPSSGPAVVRPALPRPVGSAFPRKPPLKGPGDPFADQH